MNTVDSLYPQVQHPQSDSTNCELKIFEDKKIPKFFNKQNLNLPLDGNYLYSTYIKITTTCVVFILC